jgi:O-antigen ligase
MISTKYNQNIPFYILLAAASSFVLSLFLLQLFAGLLVFIWLFESNYEKKKAMDLLTLAVLIFGIVRIASIVFSEYHASSNESLYKEALFYLGFFSFNFYLKVFDSRKKEQLILVFLGAAIFASLTGIISFDFGHVHRAESFSSGNTVYSSYLLAALPVLIFLPFKKSNKRFLIYWISGLTILLVGIITALGRTNIAVSLLVLSAAVILGKISIKNLIILISSISIILLFSFRINSAALLYRVDHPLSPADRNIIVKGAEMLIYDHPVIGFGPRTFRNIFPLLKEVSIRGIGGWHNDFLQIYFESGIIGLISFLLLLSVIFSNGIKLFKMNRGNNKNILLGFIVSESCFVLLITSGFITSSVLSIVFVLIITLQNSYWEQSISHDLVPNNKINL